MQGRSSFNRALASLVLWSAVACAVNACKAPDDPAPPTNTTNNTQDNGGGPPTGTVNDTAGFSVVLQGGFSRTKYFIHDSSDTTTWTTECKVPATATGNATNIFCTVEAPEADLYYQGLSLNYNVPTTMCTYLWVKPYGFYAQPVRPGPTQVTYWVDADGDYGVDNDNDGDVDVADAVNGPGNVVSTIAGFDEGKLSCIYDTSARDGQNCCTGSYNLTVFTWDPAANAGAGAYNSKSTPNQKWGGKPVNCFVGPYKDLAKETTDDGIPLSTVYYTDGTGLNLDMVLTAPEKKNFSSNMYLANYIDPADHGVPGIPAAFSDQQAFNLEEAPDPQPYYDFGCLDQAFEYKARIRLSVREWSTYAEFEKKGLGNPDVAGNEPPPYNTGGSDYNDRGDWLDIETLAPGAAYPGEFL